MSDEEREIWDLVREKNRAWVAGAVHEVESLYDEAAVLVKPDFLPVRGRADIVKSYEDDVHHARTHSFEELEHSVAVFADLAMVAYRYSVRRTLLPEGDEREETGREILTLRRSAGGWKVLWRTQIPE
jgi:ketosteroid isomerase-like protein